MWKKKRARATLGFFNMEMLKVMKRNQEKKMRKKGQ